MVVFDPMLVVHSRKEVKVESPPVLGYAHLKDALMRRAAYINPFDAVKRAEYVGSSEVGACLRLVTHEKVFPGSRAPGPSAIGRMHRGTVMESEIVAILREAVGFALTATGSEQLELALGFLKGHPDGDFRFAIQPDPTSGFFKLNGMGLWKYDDAAALMASGAGLLEIKTMSRDVWKEAVRIGVSETYQDQVTSNIGLADRAWSVLMAVCVDNLNDIALFLAAPNPERFSQIRDRADLVMARKAAIMLELHKLDLLRSDLSDVEKEMRNEQEDALLPDGEPERGYCHDCPLFTRCPAVFKIDDRPLPECVRLEVEAQAEIYDEARDREKQGEVDKKEAGAALRVLLESNGRSSAKLDNLFNIKRSLQDGRLSCNFDRMKVEFPQAYEACVTQGDAIDKLDVRRRKK